MRAEEADTEANRPRARARAHKGAPALSGLVAFLVVGGCASLSGDRARVQRLEHELATATCDRTLDEAWDEARRLLDERGYELAGADARAVGKTPGLASSVGPFGSLFSAARETRMEGAARVLETGWRSGLRYKLEGSAEAPGCHVAFMTVAEDPGQRGRDAWQAPRRDSALEFELLRRLAPKEATRLEAPVQP